MEEPHDEQAYFQGTRRGTYARGSRKGHFTISIVLQPYVFSQCAHSARAWAYLWSWVLGSALHSSQSNKRVVRKIVSEKRHPLSFLLSRNRILIRIQNTSLSALQKQEERLLCLVLQMQSCRFTTRSHVHFRPEYSREIIDFSRCRQENKQSLQFFFLR